MSSPYSTIGSAVALGTTVGALGYAGSFVNNAVKRTQRKVSKKSTSSKRKSNTKARGRKRR